MENEETYTVTIKFKDGTWTTDETPWTEELLKEVLVSLGAGEHSLIQVTNKEGNIAIPSREIKYIKYTKN